MTDQYRLSRHEKILDQRNTTMKRVALAGLLFSSYMLVNVLRPYSGFFEESGVMRESLEGTQRELRQTQEALGRVRGFEAVVENARATLVEAPWQSHRIELRETFRGFQSDRPPQTEYQSLADEAVEKIATDVREAMQPLIEAVEADPKLKDDIPGIEANASDMIDSATEWEQKTHGTVWYGTPDEKEATVRFLEEDLDKELQSLSGQVTHSVADLVDTIDKTRETLVGEVADLELEAETKAAGIGELDEAMQSVLPQWIRGLFGVEEMVQAFPVIVLGIALYLLLGATSLTRHYKSIAAGKDWSAQQINDPMYSSPWTLVYRGGLGTAATCGLYLAVFVVAWIFVDQGGSILVRWIDTGHEPTLDRSTYRPMLYAINVVLVGGLIFLLYKPLNELRHRLR